MAFFAEKVIRGMLEPRIGTPVLFEVPEVPSEAFPEMPERFVVLERVGFSKENHVDKLSIAVQSISTRSLADAAEFDEIVRAAVESLIDQPWISAVDLNGNYNFTDTKTGRYRYQSVYEFYFVRG